MNEWMNKWRACLANTKHLNVWLNKGGLWRIQFCQNGVRTYIMDRRKGIWFQNCANLICGIMEQSCWLQCHPGKSSRLSAHSQPFFHDSYHHSQQARGPAYLNAASISQTGPEITLLCFGLSRTSAELTSASWGWRTWFIASQVTHLSNGLGLVFCMFVPHLKLI